MYHVQVERRRSIKDGAILEKFGWEDVGVAPWWTTDNFTMFKPIDYRRYSMALENYEDEAYDLDVFDDVSEVDSVDNDPFDSDYDPNER